MDGESSDCLAFMEEQLTTSLDGEGALLEYPECYVSSKPRNAQCEGFKVML